MSTVLKTRIGPGDHGRAMTLEEFQRAEFVSGDLYELGRGIIAVNSVPNPWHFDVYNVLRRQITAFELAHPGVIWGLGGGAESRVLLEDLESERHPDLAVYTSPPPRADSGAWAEWVPDLVVEIVTPSSRYRDYDEKPEEYLRFGVKEFWIVDPREALLVVLRRKGGTWQRTEVRPPTAYDCPLFPGLRIETTPIFEAAGPAGEHAGGETDD
jgi:Uma2 family endonuclease